MATSAQFYCPQCQRPVPAEHLNTGTVFQCECMDWIRADAFPALTRPAEVVRTGELLLEADEASCFYHAQKRATTACEGCGRYLCSLCEVELAGKRLCPACIQAGKSKKKIVNLENQRVLYDELALALGVLPVVLGFFMWPFFFISAPAAFYVWIRYRKMPTSILPRRRWRYPVALTFAVLQLVAAAVVTSWIIRIVSS